MSNIDAPVPQVPQPPESNGGLRRRQPENAGHGTGHVPQSASGIHFSLWDKTPLNALQRGNMRTNGSGFAPDADRKDQGFGFDGAGIDAPIDPSTNSSANSSESPAATGSSRMGAMGAGSVGMGDRGGGASQINLNQLMRSSAGMDVRSSFGSLRMSYTDAVNAGGVNKGAAQAVFNSSSFGDGMFNFSAASSVGNGSSRGMSSGSGFNGGMGSAGSEKHPTTSLTMHMSF